MDGWTDGQMDGQMDGLQDYNKHQFLRIRQIAGGKPRPVQNFVKLSHNLNRPLLYPGKKSIFSDPKIDVVMGSPIKSWDSSLGSGWSI
jgi:hypothetical protein